MEAGSPIAAAHVLLAFFQKLLVAKRKVNKRMKHRVAAIFLPVLMAVALPARAELPWHALSLKLFGGPSQNGGTIREEGYEHEYEFGFSNILILNNKYKKKLTFSH